MLRNRANRSDRVVRSRNESAVDHAPRSERVIAWRFLVMVGVLYASLQIGGLSLDRPPSWDEAIYLSQTTPGVDALPFAPSRARGIVLLVAPVAELGGAATAVRLWLVLLSSIGLVSVFGVWVPLIGLASPLASGLLALSWPGLFYGSEVMPNLWSALIAVGVVGLSVRAIWDETTPRHQRLTAVLLFVLALLRPLDSLAVGLLLIVTSIWAGASSIRRFAAIALPILLGWLAWGIEMSLRFGGPTRAVGAALEVGHVSAPNIAQQALEYIQLIDGPPLGPEPGSTLPALGVISALLLATAVLVANVTKEASVWKRPFIRVPSIGALILAAPYLLVVSAAAPRFLLPAYALLCVPAGVGWLRLPSMSRRRANFAPVWTFLFLAGLVWQVRLAVDIERRQYETRKSAQSVGFAMRLRADQDACTFVSNAAFPQIALASGCHAERWHGIESALKSLQTVAADGRMAFLAVTTPVADRVGSKIVSFPKIRTVTRDWNLYRITSFR